LEGGVKKGQKIVEGWQREQEKVRKTLVLKSSSPLSSKHPAYQSAILCDVFF
jgi:hypothetical protein